MLGSIASRLKVLKQRMNEESQDIVTTDDYSHNQSGMQQFNQIQRPKGLEKIKEFETNIDQQTPESKYDYFREFDLANETVGQLTTRIIAENEQMN